jgi:hypothetical protein
MQGVPPLFCGFYLGNAALHQIIAALFFRRKMLIQKTLSHPSDEPEHLCQRLANTRKRA